MVRQRLQTVWISQTLETNQETLAAKVVLTHSLNIYTLCRPNRLDSIRGASAESLCDDETNSESNEMTAKE